MTFGTKVRHRETGLVGTVAKCRNGMALVSFDRSGMMMQLPVFELDLIEAS